MCVRVCMCRCLCLCVYLRVGPGIRRAQQHAVSGRLVCAIVRQTRGLWLLEMIEMSMMNVLLRIR